MRGAVRLEFVVAGVLLAVLFGTFLQRVQELQLGMERTIVDAEVLSLRTELQLAVASRIARGEEGRLAEWDGGNPLLLLGREEVGGMPPTRSAGGATMSTAWSWDAGRAVLVYRYTDGGTLALRLARGALAGRDGWALGGGLLLLRERSPGG
jgi:hypothetical protein